VELEVRLFGGLVERVGGSRVSVRLDDDATVADLRRELAVTHPGLAPLLPQVAVAVDLEVAHGDVALRDAGEVALLPPVAGGAGTTVPEAARVRVVTGLRHPPFDLDGTLGAISGPEVGGTAVFVGTVRDHAPDLRGVVRLDYSAYEPMAERMLAQLAEAVAADHPGLCGIALLHAVGELDVGAQTILIACAAAHRAEAFDACRDALERVKDHVPVFKREVTADGTARWVGLPPP
jgi:molybdopterin synthase catalytic subunit/molybdopterin converting factor small subunit